MFVEGLLQRVELADPAEAFDGLDRAAVRLHRKHQARARAIAIEQHGTGAADTVLATDMRAGEAERVTEEITQQQARLDRALINDAVDRDTYVVPSAHVEPARCNAAASARPTSAPARCRL